MTDITLNKERLVRLINRIQDDINADIFFDYEDYPADEYLGEYINDLFAAVNELRALVGLSTYVDRIENDPTIPEDQKASKYPGTDDLYLAELRSRDAIDPWDGIEGQDRDNYTDDQDREFYTAD